jgi:tetratricopeptide (TPR) repeat protein
MLFKIGILCCAWFLLAGSGLAAVCWRKAKKRSIAGLIIGFGFLFVLSFVLCLRMALNIAGHATKDEIDGAAQTVKSSSLYRPWYFRMLLDLELASLYAPSFTQAMKSGDVFQSVDLWQLRQDYVKEAMSALGQHVNLQDPRIKKNMDGLNQNLEQAKKQGAALYFQAGKLEGDKKSWPQAAAHFSRAIDLDPNNPQSFLWRAGANAQQGRQDLAIQDYDRACDMGLQNSCQWAAGLRAQLNAPGGH